MGMPVAPAFDQDAFRARTAVPDPSGVNAAFDGGDAAANTNWTQNANELIRVRFVIQQTVSSAANSNNLQTEFRLQYNNTTQGTGWVVVGAQGGGTEDVEFANAAGFADGDNTTQVLGGGSFVTGDGLEANSSDTITFTEEALSETELEIAIRINRSQVNEGDTIQLRWLYSNNDEAPPATVLETYTNTPTMTVNFLPEITDVDTDEEIDDKQTGVVVTGSAFGATQGTGKVEISDNATYGSGNVVAQTVTAWGSTSITITVVLGAMAPGTPRYVWVTNDAGERNLVGFVVHVHRAHAVRMAASPNIAASGENTTRQLVIPAGKVAGDFDGGRIQDDENPGDTINLTVDGFREDEWCLELVNNANGGSQLEFRVLVGGNVPETISVTPQLTVSGGQVGHDYLAAHITRVAKLRHKRM